MLTNTEIIKTTLAAATNVAKPTTVWGSTLKGIITIHPAAFLAITGGALVSLSTYYYAADALKKNKQKKQLVPAQTTVIEEPEPV